MTVADDARLRVLDEVAARAPGQRGAENFPVALRVLPRRVRGPLTDVYAFARFVDDVGDEAPGDRLELLGLVAADLDRLAAGPPPRLAPVAGLRAVIDAGVPVQPFRDLVAANVQDQTTAEYETFADLLGYCELSAAPVGRIVLHLALAATAANVADSDAVCAGLQVLEHCQDVGEDVRRGRVYLPAADLAAAGVTRSDLTRPDTSDGVRDVVALQVRRSRELLAAGPPLVGRLRGWARLAVSGYVAGGLATADALAAADFDVLVRDIRPSRPRTARHALRLWTS
ncbi:MAG TPA: squalene synthase HpnC [Jatrophihabitans sp.]|nr:squalene synthase HpnC [Jatrophihabitans sp.]